MRKEVLETFKNTSLKYIGNVNSLHGLGTLSKKLETAASKQILDILSLNDKEIIYTSDLSESITLGVLGYLENHNLKNKNIVIEKNINSSLDEISKKFNKNLEIRETNNIESDVNKLVDDNTLIVCTNKYDDNLIKLCRSYGCIYFLILTEDNYFKDLNGIDLVCFDSLLFKGIPGIACLIKGKNLKLEPIINGGKSTTIYRSGTPSLPFIVSLAKSIRLEYKK